MYGHPIRKSITLIFVYSAFIIGIFWLQFRSDSIINKIFGDLRVSIDQNVAPDGEISLKNRLKIAFRGINFYADDAHPLTLTTVNKKENSETTLPLLLKAWEERENGFVFNYDNDVSLEFVASQDTSETEENESRLSIVAKIPENSALSLNYKPGSGFSVNEKTDTKAIFSSKGQKFNLAAGFIEKEKLVLDNKNPVVTFAPIVEITKFYLSSITDAAAYADNGTFEKNIVQIKNGLLAAVPQTISSKGNLSELSAVAYIAEMALKGNYKAAVDAIPESVRKSNRRTYLSAPYFGSLSSMESTFTRTMENTDKIVKNTMSLNNLDAFATPDLYNYILINQKSQIVNDLLKIPATMVDFEPTLNQAQSILELYVSLKEANIAAAENLVVVLDKCIEKIEGSCAFEGEKLILSENDVAVSQLQAVQIGFAVYNYARKIGKMELIPGARLIISSALTDNVPSDLYALTELYGINGIGKNGKYYPRMVVLDNSSTVVWAWTCADTIRYFRDNNVKTGSLSIKFPLGDSHYIMIGGIPSFNAIDIYNVPFRTDPRFESYNSSGYVYNAKTKTLLLKSRHREVTETVKLYFAERPAKKTESKSAESKPVESKAAATSAPKSETTAPAGSSSPKELVSPAAPVSKTEPTVTTSDADHETSE